MSCPHLMAKQADDLGTMICRTCGEELPLREKQLLRLNEVFVFVIRDPDGNECVPAYTFPDGLTIPLVCADRERVDSLRDLARFMAAQAGQRITLCRFTTREELETIE